MAFFSLSKSNITLSTTIDFLTIISASNGRVKLHEVSIGAMDTVSSANEIGVFKSTVGTTGAGAVTMAPLVTDSVAAAFTNFTSWGTSPTLGNNILRIPCNANGGLYRWVAKPGTEPEARNTEQFSFISVVGTGKISWHVLVEQM